MWSLQHSVKPDHPKDHAHRLRDMIQAKRDNIAAGGTRKTVEEVIAAKPTADYDAIVLQSASPPSDLSNGCN